MMVCSGNQVQPTSATKRLTGVLGDQAGYALVPDDSAPRRDLYQWLGVQSRPRITDMLWMVDQATATKPTHRARFTVGKDARSPRAMLGGVQCLR